MNKKEIAAWGLIISVSQMLMSLIERYYYLVYMETETRQLPFNPVTRLYGGANGAYDMRSYGLEMEMWELTLVFYCVMVVRQMARFQEESSYMSIARYGNFHRYYKTVYSTFLQLTAWYQLFVCIGAAAGAALTAVMGSTVKLGYMEFLLIQLCLFVGNLFFGSIMLFFIVRRNDIKAAIIVYPVFPLICLFAKKLPRGICNILPGSWLMFGRSSLAAAGGFSVGAVMVVELLLFAGVSFLFFKKRTE